ncbi:cysteine desulfurase family protein [Vampirovibrio sp.]|uniref:cysteine desulfurase family protein n=1 Tax=Vampirovibrio sp. TaxID=2717857 RepID=UPI003593B333
MSLPFAYNKNHSTIRPFEASKNRPAPCMTLSPQLPVYMDHAATTPLDPLVLEAMLPYWQERFGNPSSLHRWGREARQALQASRQTLANALGCQPGEIYFTSGATEANNLAILGLGPVLKSKGRHLITTQIEHAAIASPCQWLESQGWEVTWLPVDAEGFVSPESLLAALRPDTALVSIIHGNNEIGTVQDIQKLGALLGAHNVLFHVDAVQTVGKLPLTLSALPVDYLSFSGHKIYGPKGIGALYVREGCPLPVAQVMGGGQELSVRSGTENLAGIVGMAKALERCVQNLSVETPRLQDLQAQLIQAVELAVPDAILNGPRNLTQRVPGNVHFSFPPAEGEALVLHLDLKGIAVSSGSACHSAVIEPSRVVQALGKSEAIAKATVRFSLGRDNTAADVQRVATVLPGIVNRFIKKGNP